MKDKEKEKKKNQEKQEKQGKHKRANNKMSILKIIVITICVLLMIFSGIRIIKWARENRQNKEIRAKISNTVLIDDKIETVDKYNIDFDALKQQNSDTVGWIKVNGTNIEYPVVQTYNNDYYMVHNFDETYNSAGWVFVDYKNELDGTDKNIVIFAHNRRDGSMFGTLKNILTDEWQNNEENFIVTFITENEKIEYKVFSVYMIEKEDYYITTYFGSDDAFERFIDIVQSRSEKDFGETVTIDDQILTLSTCADNNQYRVVLHAKKMVQNED